MNLTKILGLSALLVAAQSGLAQSYAQFDSVNQWSATYGPDVISNLDSANRSGFYTNGYVPTATGDGVNDYPYLYQDLTEDSAPIPNINGGYEEAGSDSYATVYGSATQFNGINHFVDYTNTGIVNETVTWTSTVAETLSATGTSTAVAYGGWSFYDPNAQVSVVNFFTNGLNGDGTSTGTDLFGAGFPLYVGYTQDSNFPLLGTDTYSVVLTPGETIDVQYWASGSSSAQAVPEPASLLALVPLLFLRRRSR